MKKFKNVSKRLVVYLIALAMLVTIAPSAALADEASADVGGVSDQIAVVNDQADNIAEDSELNLRSESVYETQDPAIAAEDEVSYFIGDETADVSAKDAKSEPVVENIDPEEILALADDYPELELDKEISLDSNEAVWYKFVPTESGEYRIQSYSRSYGDPIVYLYNSDLEEIASGDDYDNNRNFYLRYEFEQGKVYYFQIAEYDGEEFSYNVIMNKVQETQVTFYANNDNAYFDDEIGDETSTYINVFLVGDSIDTEIEPSIDNDNLFFAGWSEDPNAAEPDENILVKSDMILYAVWSKAVTVTFHANNDAAYYEIWNEEEYEYEPVESYAQKYVPDTVIYDNEDYIENYDTPYHSDNLSFKGWSADKDAVVPDEYITATGGLELYAVWEENVMVSVTFHANNSNAYYEDWDEDDNLIKNESYTRNLVEGYEIYGDYEPDEYPDNLYFLGWSENKNAKEADGVIYARDGLELYAVWTNNYKVTFNVNNKDAYYEEEYWDDNEEDYLTRHISSKEQWFRSGYIIDEFNNEPECSNSAIGFAGWSTDKNATEPDEAITITKDTVLYGVWKNYVTVTFNANGGFFVEYNEDDDDYIEVSTVQEKVFEGTFLGTIFSVYAQNKDLNKVRSGKYAYTANGAALDEDTPVKNGDTFYILWDDIVEVTLDANGGTISNPYYGDYYGDYLTLRYTKGKTANINWTASKDDQAFIGWSTDGTEKNIVNSITPVSDMTLKAVYKDGYNVTIENADSIRINGKWYYGSAGFVWAKDVPLSRMDIYVYLYESENVFAGLSTTSNGNNIIGNDYMPTGDVTLYAVFNPGYRINLYPSEGIFTADKIYNSASRSLCVKKGDKIGTVPTPTAPAGKIFVGWRDEAEENSSNVITDISGIVPTSDKYFTAVYKKDITAANITVNTASVAYTGKAVTKAVSVKYNNLTLTLNKDYTVSYKNNNKAGTATLTITGTGKYAGSVSKTFKITKGKNTLTVKAKAQTIKYSKVKSKKQTIKRTKAITVNKAQGKVIYKLTKVAKAKFKKYFSVNSKNGNITVKKGLKKGKYTLSIKVTAKGNANYKSLSKTVKVKVTVK